MPIPHINAKLTVRAYDDKSVSTSIDDQGTPNPNPLIGDDVGMSEAWFDTAMDLYGLLEIDSVNDPYPAFAIGGPNAKLCAVVGAQGEPSGEKGPTGPVGETGPVGVAGRRGNRGVKGDTGPAGDPGTNNVMFNTPGQFEWTVPGSPGDPKYFIGYVMQNPGGGNSYTANYNHVKNGTAKLGLVYADAGSTILVNVPVDWDGHSNNPTFSGKSVYRTWFDYVEDGVAKTVYPTYDGSSGAGDLVISYVNHELGGAYVSNALTETNPSGVGQQVRIGRGGDPGGNGWLSGVGGGGSYGGPILDIAVSGNQPGKPTGAGGTSGAKIRAAPQGSGTGGRAYIWLLWRKTI